MTVSDALYGGFGRAHRHVGSIFLDVIWKVIWLAVNAGLLFLFVMWLYSESQSIEVHAPVNALRSPVGLVVLARELWAAYASTVFVAVLVLAALSALAWVLMEAYFRAGILSNSEGSFGHNASRYFGVFLASAIVRILMISSVVAVLGAMIFSRYMVTPAAEWKELWTDTRAPFAVAVLVCATVWFLLTLLETLIRSDALDLLGSELFLVTGLIATLVTFEGMIVATFVAVIVVLAMTLSSAEGAVAVLALTVGALVFLSVVHSYLLIVRFSSIADIMGHVDDL